MMYARRIEAGSFLFENVVECADNYFVRIQYGR